nr:hypothetical protein [Candidatus Sigynarchaeum springense]
MARRLKKKDEMDKILSNYGNEMDQTALANKLGISRGTVANYANSLHAEKKIDIIKSSTGKSTRSYKTTHPSCDLNLERVFYPFLRDGSHVSTLLNFRYRAR